ncbi:MAG: MoxR family ATPase [Promethearchaeota archaeon]|nr:MAG: MoxR family ATPase [Candidatus Lokiarchaeota archaeon]
MKPITEFKTKFEQHQIIEETTTTPLIMEGQYQRAYENLLDAYHAGLYAGIVGPVGSGKTALCRKFAEDHSLGFSWVTFSDLIRPSSLIGTFDPTLVFKVGYNIDAFIPGPFTLASIEGNIFFANEVNRGEEYVLNTLLDALEEKRLYIPQLKSWITLDENFYFIASMNPSDLRGTRVLPEAFKDRIRVWITLDYPDKEVEKKIIRMNCPELEITDEDLMTLIEIVSQTRQSPVISKPASIRTSIGFAKMLGERCRRLQISPTKEIFKDVGQLVLTQSLEFSPGITPDNVLNEIIERAFHK